MTANEAISKWEAEIKASRFRRMMPVEVEKAVRAYLRTCGVRVELTSHKAPVDLVGDVAAEVKASNWVKGSNGQWRYQFNTKPHQVARADYVICVCQDLDDHCFIIPSDQISGRTVEITQRDPRKYRGRYAQYLENWDQVKQGENNV